MTDPIRHERILRLNAALDGELDPTSALAIRSRLARRPGAGGKIPAARSAARRDSAATPRARRRRSALVDRSPLAGAGRAFLDCRPLRRRGVPHGAALRSLLAASFAVLGFAVGAGFTSLRMQDASQGVAENLVSDFSRAAIAGQPFDVASSDRHTVKPWLAGRTTVSASTSSISCARVFRLRAAASRSWTGSRADARLPPWRAPRRRHRAAA